MKNIIIALTFLAYYNGYMQNDRLALRSFSFGNGIGTSSKYEYVGKASANADLAAAYNSNIFAVYFNIGSSISTYSYDVREHHGLFLTYGRELNLVNWFKIEVHSGLGYANFIGIPRESSTVRHTNRVAAIPLNLKLLFYPGNSFGLGVNPSASFSSFTNVYAVNLIFQWKFK